MNKPSMMQFGKGNLLPSALFLARNTQETTKFGTSIPHQASFAGIFGPHDFEADAPCLPYAAVTKKRVVIIVKKADMCIRTQRVVVASEGSNVDGVSE